MHCKQADSAILKLLLFQASMERRYFITKQTHVVIMHFCRDMGLCRIYAHFVANRILSLIRAVLGLFCADFYADI